MSSSVFLALTVNQASFPLFSRRIQEIKRERLPQVLAIQHNDEEDGEQEDDEEEGFGGTGNDSSAEENSEDKHSDTSPDSSFLSLSPGEYSPN